MISIIVIVFIIRIYLVVFIIVIRIFIISIIHERGGAVETGCSDLYAVIY